MERGQLTALHNELSSRFDEGELRTLCFELGVDYESLPGSGKANKARELITYFQRRDRIQELIESVERKRPNIQWGNRKIPETPALERKFKIPAPPLKKKHAVQIVVALIGAAAVVIAAWIGLAGGGEGVPTPTSLGSIFNYQVQVRDQDTGEAIEGANVTIAVGGDIAPIDDVTDSKGFAIIPIDASRVGKLGRLIVKAPGYEEQTQNINLTENTLPDMVQLVLAP